MAMLCALASIGRILSKGASLGAILISIINRVNAIANIPSQNASKRELAFDSGMIALLSFQFMNIFKVFRLMTKSQAEYFVSNPVIKRR